MQADQAVSGSVLEPDELKLIGQAFDQAWSLVRPTLEALPREHESARLRLATIILNEQRDRPLDPARLRDRAVACYRAEREPPPALAIAGVPTERA